MNTSGQVCGILETVMYADDLTGVREFYENILGLEVVSYGEEHFVFFRCGAGMLLFFNPAKTAAQAEDPSSGSVPAHGASGPGHVAFRIPQSSLPHWRSRLEQQQVEIEHDATWSNGGHSIYFRDPANNSVELATARLWGLDVGDVS